MGSAPISGKAGLIELLDNTYISADISKLVEIRVRYSNLPTITRSLTTRVTRSTEHFQCDPTW